MKRYLDISTHALVISAFMSLAFTSRLDFPSVAIFTAGILWSLYRTVQMLPPMLGARSTFYLSFAYAIFFLADNLVISRSFVPATVHMLLFLLLAKLHMSRSERDYFYIIVLAFLMVLAAASLTVDFSYLVTLLLFLISLVATLMSFEIFRSQHSNSKEATTVGGSLTGVSVWASAWIILLGSALFFAIPRVGTGYFSRAANNPVLLTGFSDNVRLGEIGEIKKSSAVVMRAKRVSGRPSSGLRWRGIALDRFDGSVWHKSEVTREEVQQVSSGVYLIQPLERVSDGVQYDILLEPMATATLFGPYRVRTVSLKQEPVMSDHEESIFTRTQLPRRIQYQVLSEVSSRNASGPTADPPDMTRYLQLPQDLDPRVLELASTITKGRTSPLEKASVIESYLRKNYRYSLNLSWPPGSQPISTFLFNAKNGHCEYFASAMAILLRSIGIPTRLVNGFQMGEFNPVGSDYIVRESDAHSWVEAYIPGRGWMEFDATPPDMRPAVTGVIAQLGHYFDAIELEWSSYILVYDTESQSQLFRSAQDSLQSLQSGLRSGTDKWSLGTKKATNWLAAQFVGEGSSTFWLMAVLVLFLSTAVYYRREFRSQWQIWRFRNGRGQLDRELIEHLFLRVARLAEHRKISRVPAQTWREWARKLPDPGKRSIVLDAIGVFEKSRYGCDPVSASDYTTLENAIRALKG